MRVSEIIELGYKQYEVTNTIGKNVSRAFPPKIFKTMRGAETYGMKFLEWES